uniref:Uncharacterized protein n=1 Tax=Plectus sambesii TaxID=2011161 RepID=A0A914XMM3_9BILA
MAAKKRPLPSSFDDVYRTEVQQLPLIFDEHVDYEQYFEDNMRFLELDINRPWDNMVSQAWNWARYNLRYLKAKWLFYQNRASLAIPIPKPPNASEKMWDGDTYKLREKFQRMYAYLERYPDWHEERKSLIEESMIAEWPRTYTPFSEGGEVKSLTVDRAPILHMSMKTDSADVQRWRPTVQLSVLALNKETAKGLLTRFTARLVPQSLPQVQLKEPWESVGKLISTQRMGSKAVTPKGIHSNGDALVITGGIDEQGALWYDKTVTLCAQFSDLASSATRSYEQGALLFDDNDTLCARFSNLGLYIGKKRRKPSRLRYCIEIVSEIRLASGLELKQTTLSHPFLIAPNYDQSKIISGDIIWDILSTEQGNTNTPVNERKVAWQKLKLMVQHYVQSQLIEVQSHLIEARTLDNDELLHIQTMLFLPLALSRKDLVALELDLFGYYRVDINKQGIRRIKYRLLRESVRDDYPVDHHSFFTQKCIELKDYETELQHSVWEWLFEAVEVLMDRNNSSLLCEDVSQPKLKKDKKSSLMLKLFNDRIITMSSREREWIAYKMLAKYDATHQPHQQTRAMLIRFCESVAGSLSFGYSNNEGSELKPLYGSMTAQEIKNMKNGLSGMVVKATWPSKFDRLVRFKCDKAGGRSGVSFLRKQQVFKVYVPTANTLPVTKLVKEDRFKIHPVHGPLDYHELNSPSYSSCSESPHQAQNQQPSQPHSLSYPVDMLGEGWAVVRQTVGLSELRKKCATMSVSTVSSGRSRFFKNKKIHTSNQ